MRLYEIRRCTKDGNAITLSKTKTSVIVPITIPAEFVLNRLSVGCETDSVGTVNFTATLYTRDVDTETSGMGNAQKAAYTEICKIASVTGTTVAPNSVVGTYFIANRSTKTLAGGTVYLKITLASAINDKDTTWAVSLVGRIGGALE